MSFVRSKIDLLKNSLKNSCIRFSSKTKSPAIHNNQHIKYAERWRIYNRKKNEN